MTGLDRQKERGRRNLEPRGGVKDRPSGKKDHKSDRVPSPDIVRRTGESLGVKKKTSREQYRVRSQKVED